MTAVEILQELIAIPTPSSVSNLPLLEWVTRYLQTKGWRVQLLPYTDDCGVAKANMIARPASAPKDDASVELAFVCHTDTVPFATNWTTALDLKCLNANAHGCGACDVKGALACFLAALDNLPPAQTNPNIALILTADEEIGCKGMDRLLAETGFRIRSALVSEPTSLRPGIAGKGYGLARVTIQGLEAHSAFPNEGLSAISLAARFISRIETRVPQPANASDPLFDPPMTTVNIGTIHGGSAKNIIAGECSFLIEWRPIPADPPHRFLAILEALGANMQEEEPRARIVIEPLRAEPGFAPSIDAVHPLQQRLQEIFAETGRPSGIPTGISFGSEASRLTRIAEEVIVIGPGDMHTAHSDRERVPLTDLEEWTAALRALISLP
ncbi:MAG: M20/M25/M40 family metallo-hydrolase [Terracidiphilus sp.]